MGKIKITNVVFMMLLLGLALKGDLFALKAEFEEIKRYEEIEKSKPEVIERPVVEYDVRTLRDPFESPFVRPPDSINPADPTAAKPVEYPPPALTVQGIIWGGAFPQAIINDKVVKVGDTIDEVKILSIDKYGISVYYKEKKYDFNSPAAGGSIDKKPGG